MTARNEPLRALSYDAGEIRESTMQIETVGKYQIHLIAHEVEGGKRWDPFVSVLRFDEEADDFRCVLEKHHASEEPCDSYEEAVETARRAGNAFIQRELQQ
jgi:hypothetical protein